MTGRDDLLLMLAIGALAAAQLMLCGRLRRLENDVQFALIVSRETEIGR